MSPYSQEDFPGDYERGRGHSGCDSVGEESYDDLSFHDISVEPRILMYTGLEVYLTRTALVEDMDVLQGSVMMLNTRSAV